jgi:hypothetical protein
MRRTYHIKARWRSPGIPPVIFTYDIGKYATCMREIDVPLLFSTRAEIKDEMSGVWVDL